MTFPLVAIAAVCSDATHGQHIVSRRKIKVATACFVAAAMLGTIALCALVVGFRSVLPPLVVDGQFQSICRTLLFPVAIGLNVL